MKIPQIFGNAPLIFGKIPQIFMDIPLNFVNIPSNFAGIPALFDRIQSLVNGFVAIYTANLHFFYLNWKSFFAGLLRMNDFYVTAFAIAVLIAETKSSKVAVFGSALPSLVFFINMLSLRSFDISI